MEFAQIRTDSPFIVVLTSQFVPPGRDKRPFSSPEHPIRLRGTPSLLPGRCRWLLLGVKWLWSEADHSPASSVEVKNAWSYTWNPSHVFMACYLRKRWDSCSVVSDLFWCCGPSYRIQRIRVLKFKARGAVWRLPGVWCFVNSVDHSYQAVVRVPLLISQALSTGMQT